MKKKVKIILSIFFTILFCVLCGFYITNNNSYNIPTFHKQTQEIKAKITGSVKFPGEKYFKKGTILKDIFKKFEPLPKSDLSAFKLEEKQFKDINIEIQNQKPLLVDNLNEETFKTLKLNKKLLIKLKELFQNNKSKKISWENIEQIQGIGLKSLEKLQKNFSLEQ